MRTAVMIASKTAGVPCKNDRFPSNPSIVSMIVGSQLSVVSYQYDAILATIKAKHPTNGKQAI